MSTSQPGGGGGGPPPHPSPTAVEGTVFADDTPEVSRSYADALLEAAVADGQVDAILDELDAIGAEVLDAHPQLATVLNSPLVSIADKDRILVATFEGRALATVVRFLRVLNRHGRLGSFAAIARAARAAWDRRQGRKPVQVRAAAPLDDDQLAALRDRVARFVGGTPVLHVTVDPALIGGLVIQSGDDVYDASVRSRLEQLRQRLIEGKTHEIQSRRDHFSHLA